MVLLLMTALVVISNVVMMYGFKLLVDAIPNSAPDELWSKVETPFWIIVVCCIFHLVMYRVRDILDMFVTPQVQNALREMVMENLLKHSQEYFLNGSRVNLPTKSETL